MAESEKQIPAVRKRNFFSDENKMAICLEVGSLMLNISNKGLKGLNKVIIPECALFKYLRWTAFYKQLFLRRNYFSYN